MFVLNNILYVRVIFKTNVSNRFLSTKSPFELCYQLGNLKGYFIV